MIDVFEEAIRAARTGQEVALATVVRAQGSTPRSTGSKMLVRKDGSIYGTIGGGEMEGRAIQEAMAALADGQPRLIHYTFREVAEAGVGICGGENEVFIEVIGPPRELLIVGAGHVGQAVARLGAFLGMDCIVFDHRAEFANAERFPQARKIIVGDMAEGLARYSITGQTYITIVTRGHVQDADTLATVIRSPAAFIGMIGSQTKTRIVLNKMRDRGIEPEYVERVRAQIGLAIGAETPEEIAVSITAQIIAVMHGCDERKARP